MEGVLIFWVGFSVIVGFVADAKGRSGIGYGLLSVLLSPILVLILVLVMPDLAKAKQAEAERQKQDERRAEEQKREHEKQLEALRALKTEPPTGSTADELAKLAGLLKDGVLTQDEFEQQKRRLLQVQ